MESLESNSAQEASGDAAQARDAVDAVLRRYPRAETRFSPRERGTNAADAAFDRAVAELAQIGELPCDGTGAQ